MTTSEWIAAITATVAVVGAVIALVAWLDARAEARAAFRRTRDARDESAEVEHVGQRLGENENRYRRLG
jgi:hypothetical protein